MWIQIILSVFLALTPPPHLISFPLSSCWFFVVLGPLPGEPVSDQLCHIIKCCEYDYQELNKKRDSYAETHQPKSGEERPVWFVHWPRTPCTDYACRARLETGHVYKTTIVCCSTEFWVLESFHPWPPSFWGRRMQKQALSHCWITLWAELWLQVWLPPSETSSHSELQLQLRFSPECGPQTCNISFIWELTRLAKAQLPLQMHRVRIYLFPVPWAGDWTHALTILGKCSTTE